MKPINYTDELIFWFILALTFIVLMLVFKCWTFKQIIIQHEKDADVLRNKLWKEFNNVIKLKELVSEQEKLLLDVKINNCEVVGCVYESKHIDIPNLFTTLAQQINYESTINGLDMTAIVYCFNDLQDACKYESNKTL